MQCKLHTFPVLSQDFAGKSKKIGSNLVTRLPAFWMYGLYCSWTENVKHYFAAGPAGQTTVLL